MTLDLSLPEQFDELKPRITVIGVGGAGGNAINNMIRCKLTGVEFMAANTDSQALRASQADHKVQLGLNITHGLGAGSRPDVGRAAAEEAQDEIMAALDACHMVFITAGMGGGTGTGAAPVIARMAREHGILTVGVVTKPFHFEGAHRMRTAEAGIAELASYVDTLIVIPNQNLFRIASEKTTFAEAFHLADDVLHSGVRGVTDLMVREGLINLDFADIRAVMREMGKAMMGTGEAAGEKRAVEAAEAAISNPLLDDASMKGARGVLINITGGLDMTLFEVDEATNRIRDEVDPEANIIFGATFDDSLDGSMRVSVVATGIDGTGNAAIAGTYQPRQAPATEPAVERAAEPVTEPAVAAVRQPMEAAAGETMLAGSEATHGESAGSEFAGSELAGHGKGARDAGAEAALTLGTPVAADAAATGEAAADEVKPVGSAAWLAGLSGQTERPAARGEEVSGDGMAASTPRSVEPPASGWAEREGDRSSLARREEPQPQRGGIWSMLTGNSERPRKSNARPADSDAGQRGANRLSRTAQADSDVFIPPPPAAVAKELDEVVLARPVAPAPQAPAPQAPAPQASASQVPPVEPRATDDAKAAILVRRGGGGEAKDATGSEAAGEAPSAPPTTVAKANGYETSEDNFEIPAFLRRQAS